jgi:hypothetical protein
LFMDLKQKGLSNGLNVTEIHFPCD